MTDPRFEPRLRQSLGDRFFPNWSQHAACAERSRPGVHWTSAFLDEVAQKDDPADYVFPDKVIDVLRVCAGCPVRRQCLEYAFEMEKGVSEQWWSGELVEEDRRFGVWGGIPGRIREHFAKFPDRLERCEQWFEEVAYRKRWETAARRKEGAA